MLYCCPFNSSSLALQRSLLDSSDEMTYILPMLEKMEEKLEAADFVGEDCLARVTCEAVRPIHRGRSKFGTIGHAVNQLHGLVE